jgi:hypothetical protein
VSEAERRVGVNESVFRDVNERIDELGDQHDLGETEFVCECADTACTERLILAKAEYEAVRAHPDRFFLVPGHQRLAAERILEQHDRYFVVEKLGEAAEIAEETDPRE